MGKKKKKRWPTETAYWEQRNKRHTQIHCLSYKCFNTYTKTKDDNQTLHCSCTFEINWKKLNYGHLCGPMLPPGCHLLYFKLVFGCRLSKVSPPSMSLGLSYTVVIRWSSLGFFTGCNTSFSPWYLQKTSQFPSMSTCWQNKTLFLLLVLVSEFTLTQSLFCSWDADPHSLELQESQSGCFPVRLHPSSPAFPSHVGQNPIPRPQCETNIKHNRKRDQH